MRGAFFVSHTHTQDEDLYKTETLYAWYKNTFIPAVAVPDGVKCSTIPKWMIPRQYHPMNNTSLKVIKLMLFKHDEISTD